MTEYMKRAIQILTAGIAASTMMTCGMTKASNADYQTAILMSEIFESVFVAHSDLFRGTESGSLPAKSRTVLKVPFAMLMEVLALPTLASLGAKVRGGDANIIVGARNFRLISAENRPVLPSPIVSEASFVIYDAKGTIDLKSDIKFDPTSELNGRPVWKATFIYGAPGNSVMLFFFQPETNVVVAATELHLLREVAPLLSHRQPVQSDIQKCLLTDIEGSPVWGYRNYKIAKEQQPGAFVIDQINGLTVDPRATCLVFSVDRDAVANLKYVTFPEDDTPFRLNDFDSSSGKKNVAHGKTRSQFQTIQPACNNYESLSECLALVPSYNKTIMGHHRSSGDQRRIRGGEMALIDASTMRSSYKYDADSRNHKVVSVWVLLRSPLMREARLRNPQLGR